MVAVAAIASAVALESLALDLADLFDLTPRARANSETA
jgi:hypothetical protein